MKIGEAENDIRKKLQTVYEEEESINLTRLIIESVTGFSSSERIFKKREELSADQLHLLNNYMPRLQQHEPVQYVLNQAFFYGLQLYVNKSVLIPRPETEELVEWIIKDVKASGKDVFEGKPAADKTTVLKILDVGTGSGCIALALKKNIPGAEVWGCDVSDEALNIARRNGSALNIRVDFQGINFLDKAAQKGLPTVDIIVSNPPYVPAKEIHQMKANVVDYEPHTALFVPDNDALIFYKALAAFGKNRLHTNGNMYVEIHEEMGKDIAGLFTKEGYDNVELKKDMQGKDRMVKAVKKG